MSAADLAWMRRVKRRYGWVFDLAFAQRTPALRDVLLTVGVGLFRVDRFAFTVCGL